jgi:RNA polymerase sigma factor (sigma-70 family)
MSAHDDVRRRIEVVWRIEAPRLIAGLTRMLHDLGLAEEMTQDALVAALETWPLNGIPERPGAWLMTTARRRAIDYLRRDTLAARKHAQVGYELTLLQHADDADVEQDEGIGDNLLRLMFTACHPVLSTDARVALTLRVLGGLSTPEIARAFLVPEATIAQRIVRAKRTLAEKQVPFELPPMGELAARLASVLEVIYLIFNEGYAATVGTDWMRPALCEQALRLGRVLTSLAPREPEVYGLVALMELQASRFRARIDAQGDPVLLAQQDRACWDTARIRRGLAALARAQTLGGEDGPYALQAALAACHARAGCYAATDWSRIAALYARLTRVAPSPVVELNRAVAVAMVDGAQAGLSVLDALVGEPRLVDYHLLPSVRGELLATLGRNAEARAAFEQAAALAGNTRERALLTRRAAACVHRRPG